MQRLRVSSSLLTVAFCALSLHAQTGGANESTPATGTPAPTAVQATTLGADLGSVKLQNDIEPVESLKNPMVLPGYSFEESRSTPIFGTPGYFRRALGSSEIRVELQSTRGFEEYIRDEKLQLSLRSYLDLVLANNTNIALQKILLETPKNAVLRATAFLDPTFTGGFTATRSQNPATSQTEGADIVSSLDQPTNLSYQQTFLPGTQLTTSANVNRSSSNNQLRFFNPVLNTGFRVDVAQPLLRNRGVFINKVPILIARNTVRSAEFQFENQVINLLSQAESAYWDYLEARENLRVQDAALRLREASLTRAKRELELGAIPELDVFQPQADFAQAEVNFTQARFRVARAEDALRQQIGVDLIPSLRTVPIEITDTVNPPAPVERMDREEYVTVALSNRPDLLQQRQQLVGNDLSIKQTANQLRPNLALTLRYSSAARGGRELIDGIENSVGLWNTLGSTFAFDYPTYAIGFQLSLPMRNRAAIANYSDAMVQKKSTMLQIRNLEQTARLDVLNAINNLEASRESVRLAGMAREFAQKRLEAEQKKYDLGTVTLFFLQAAQTDLITAEQRLVTESINYNRNRLTLLRISGTLLDERGVVIR